MSEEIEANLQDSERDLWHRYQHLHAQAPRKVALEALDLFIKRVLAYPKDQRDRFVATLCRAVVDEEKNLPIQYPLFEKLIAPYLVRHYWVREPWVARWIAFFVDWFYRSERCREMLGLIFLPSPLKAKERALRQALEWRPEDDQARRQLDDLLNPKDPAVRRAKIGQMASGFDYAVHEVPSGVLYGIDGATVPQCQRLLEDLGTFRELVKQEMLLEAYADRIERWQAHFQGYQDYLLNRTQYQSYAHYLQVHSIRR